MKKILVSLGALLVWVPIALAAGLSASEKESHTKRTYQFLKDTGVYFIATAEDKQPRVRPFGTALFFENRLYIQTGKTKAVAKQIAANPFVEICALSGDKKTWLRLSAELVEDGRVEARKAMLSAYPELRSMYNENDGNMVVFYLKNAKATFNSFAAAPETLEF